MPVQGICHTFQFVQSLCFLALAQFANFGLFSCIKKFTDLIHRESSVIRQQPNMHDHRLHIEKQFRFGTNKTARDSPLRKPLLNLGA